MSGEQRGNWQARDPVRRSAVWCLVVAAVAAALNGRVALAVASVIVGVGAHFAGETLRRRTGSTGPRLLTSMILGVTVGVAVVLALR